MEPWIETASGKEFWFLSQEPQFDINDIATALSNICRFNGHSKFFYSVAEHSYYVSKLVPKEFAYAALLHDATEAYLNDITKPAKELLPDYKQLEEDLTTKLAKYFGFASDFSNHNVIKQADWAQLKIEAYHLLPSKGKNWYFPDNLQSGFEPLGYSPRVAKQLFLDRLREIQNANNFS